ncbi:MAG: hypothetical protein ACYTG3_14430 [Planctomycetota bacterium]|jgi:hypothetical protein
MTGRRTTPILLATPLLLAAGVLRGPFALAQDGGETPRQFIERREAELAPDDIWGHLELADLAHGVGLKEAARKHAEIVISLAGANEIAREILGHTRHKGKWLTPGEAKAAGLLEFHGEWLTKKEHKQHVRRRDWEQCWEINKRGISLKTNTSRRKLNKYFRVFSQFKHDMESMFGLRLDKKYKVNVYASKDEYHTTGRGPRGSGGYYRPGNRSFHFFDDPDFYQARRIFFHEGTHMFVNLTNNNKAFRYPHWLNEGLAEYCGGSRLDYETGKYTFGHILNDRLAVIQRRVNAHRYEPLEEFIQSESLRGAYDQGWSLVLFLRKRDGGKSAKRFGVFLKRLREGKQKMNIRKRGIEALGIFESLFLAKGETLEGFEADWVEFVKNLRPEPGAPDFRTMRSMR